MKLEKKPVKMSLIYRLISGSDGIQELKNKWK